jgi:hypothetical protein
MRMVTSLHANSGVPGARHPNLLSVACIIGIIQRVEIVVAIFMITSRTTTGRMGDRKSP